MRPLAPDAPAVIGRYRVLVELGAGGMGRVLLGLGPDGRFLAIKQIHPHLAHDREYRARFRREVTASTRVSGAFTAPVIDFDVDGDPPWLASAFVVGIPLDQAVREHGPLPIPAVRALAIGLAVALQDIHAAGLVHRDLKPANVMLAADGPKVIDFGIAQVTGAASGLTETGSALGSPAYMSPEQALSQPITSASDIFSLGSLLVLAATGTGPFVTSTMAYTLFNIVHTEPDLSRVPPQLREMLAACLHKDPARRPTPAQLIDHLGQLATAAAPWPPALHAAIDQQARHVTAVAANPDATLVVSRAGSGTRPASGSMASGVVAVRRKRRRRGIVFAAALGLLALALVASGITWLSRTEPAVHHRADSNPTLAQMRNADVCAWLRQSLRGVTASGLPADLPDWTWRTRYSFGCSVEQGEGSLIVEAGVSKPLTKDIGTAIDGMPVLGYSSFSDSCTRGVQPSGTGAGWAISVLAWRIPDATACDVAQEVLARLLSTRHDIPVHADPATLATIDPCSLVDRDRLNGLIGPIPDNPTTVTAHTCEWDGTQTVTTTLELWGGNTGVSPIELGDGIGALAESPTPYRCTLHYLYRTTAAESEMLTVTAAVASSAGDGNGEKLCETAKPVMKAEVARLPKAK